MRSALVFAGSGKLLFANHHGPLEVNSGGDCGGDSIANNLIEVLRNSSEPGWKKAREAPWRSHQRVQGMPSFWSGTSTRTLLPSPSRTPSAAMCAVSGSLVSGFRKKSLLGPTGGSANLPKPGPRVPKTRQSRNSGPTDGRTASCSSTSSSPNINSNDNNTRQADARRDIESKLNQTLWSRMVLLYGGGSFGGVAPRWQRQASGLRGIARAECRGQHLREHGLGLRPEPQEPGEWRRPWRS